MKTNVRRSLKAGLFLLILAALNFLLARIYETVIMSSSSLVLTTERVLKQVKKGKAEILVLGDSHAGTAINPIHFNRRLVTWTSAGEKYHHNYYKLKYFLANCQRPEVVILPLDIHSFTSNFSPEKDDFYWVNYIDYLEFGKKRNQASKFFHKYLKGQFFPYADESATIYQWLLKEHLDTINAGFAPVSITNINKKKKKDKKIESLKRTQSNVPETNKQIGTNYNIIYNYNIPGNDADLSERQKAAEQRVLNHFYKRDFFDPLKVYYFNQILALCCENNIRVLLVKFPVTLEYCKYVAEHFFSLPDYYKKIQPIIPKNCPEIHILDYQDIFFNRPDLMQDPDHVNRDGQKIVSQKINSEIEKLLQGKH